MNVILPQFIDSIAHRFDKKKHQGIEDTDMREGIHTPYTGSEPRWINKILKTLVYALYTY